MKLILSYLQLGVGVNLLLYMRQHQGGFKLEITAFPVRFQTSLAYYLKLISAKNLWSKTVCSSSSGKVIQVTF